MPARRACSRWRLIWIRRKSGVEQKTSRQSGVDQNLSQQASSAVHLPPISDAADESSGDSRGQVEPSFDSSEVTRLEVVARDLLRAHGWRANMDFLWAHTRWSRLARAVVAAHRRASRDLIAVRRVSWYRIANRLVLREANDRGILWSNVRAGSGTAIAHVKSGGTLTEYHWMMMRKSACQRTRQFACQFSVPGGA